MFLYLITFYCTRRLDSAAEQKEFFCKGGLPCIRVTYDGKGLAFIDLVDILHKGRKDRKGLGGFKRFQRLTSTARTCLKIGKINYLCVKANKKGVALWQVLIADFAPEQKATGRQISFKNKSRKSVLYPWVTP